MTIDEVKYIREICMSIVKKDKLMKNGEYTAEPLCIRLDNDVILDGYSKFFIWDDTKGVLAYYSNNEKTGSPMMMVGTSKPRYAGLIGFSTYDNIQEIFVPLQEESFRQSLALVKQKGFVGIKEFGKTLPIDDRVGRKIQQAIFDSTNPRKTEFKEY